MEIILAHIQERTLNTHDRTGDRRYCTLSIPVFILWANSIGWQLPQEFKGYETSRQSARPLSVSESSLPVVGAPMARKKVTEPLKIPEKITIPWLWHNTDYKFWGWVITAAISAVVTSFGVGWWAAQSVWISQLMERKAAPPITPLSAENLATPAASSDKMKIDSTVKK